MSDALFDIHLVNAFSTDPKGGNPAAVCLLDRWPEDDVMRKIGMTAGPSVTAFVLPPENGEFPLRWFTRGGREVQSFCGHATFAAAHMLAQADPSLDRFSFRAVSGQFLIRSEGGRLGMEAAAWNVEPSALPDALSASLGHSPTMCLRGERDWLLLYDDAGTIADLRPDYDLMRTLGDVGIIVTAATGPSSFGFRFFCPGFSIGEDEDPGTGSAISTLAPFWAGLKGDRTFSVTQLSERTAQFECRLLSGAVELISAAVTIGCERR